MKQEGYSFFTFVVMTQRSPTNSSVSIETFCRQNNTEKAAPESSLSMAKNGI